MAHSKKPKVPGRIPDEQFSLAAFKKMKEEIEEMKSIPSPAAASGPDGHGTLKTPLMRKCATASDKRHHHDEEDYGGIFHEYVRDYTQSAADDARRRRGPADCDLRQSKMRLSSSSRYWKLDEDTQFRSNPDWVEEHKELNEKHGSWHRVKTAQDRARQRALEKQEADAVPFKKPQPKNHNPLAKQLRDMQREFATLGSHQNLPKPLKLGGKKRLAAYDVCDDPDDALRGKTPQQKACYKFLEWALIRFGSIMETYKVLDQNGTGEVSRRDFLQTCAKKGFVDDPDPVFDALDKNGNGFVSIKEFISLKPFMEELLGNLDDHHESGAFAEAIAHHTPKCSGTHEHVHPGTPDDPLSPGTAHHKTRASAAHHMEHKGPGSKLINQYHALQHHRTTMKFEEAKKRKEFIKGSLPCISLPQTCSLTVFRNADKYHTGNEIFLKQVPSSLENLYAICDKTVRPVIGTVQQLLDRDLRPLKSLDDLQSGGKYLAKGPEALFPPPAFWGIPFESVRQALLPKTRPPMSSETNDRPSHAPTEAIETQKPERSSGVAPMIGPFVGKKQYLQKVASNSLDEITEFDVLKAEGHYLRREIMSSTTSASTPLNTMSKTTGSLMNRSASSGWSTAKSTGSKGSSSLGPIALFQNWSPDPLSRTRDREWRVYERALGDVTYMDVPGLPDDLPVNIPQLRMVQSTPALMDHVGSFSGVPGSVPPKPGMVDKATVVTPEFNMRRVSNPSLPSI